MKALCHPYWFWLEGFIRSRFVGCLHTFLVTSPSRVVVHGLLGLISNLLVSLYIVSPGYGLVYTIGVCIFGYDGYDAKGISLRLIAISWLYFYISITRVDWGKLRGLCPVCSQCYYGPMRSLAPLFIVSPTW
jgi:hypothetical protein